MKPYYEHAGITIYHGDCREVMATWPECIRFDALVTDPPYGVEIGTNDDKRGNHHLVKDAYASYDDTPDNYRAVVVPAIDASLSLVTRGLVFCAGHMAWELPRPDAIGGVFLPSASGCHGWGFNSLAHCLLYGKAPANHLGRKPTAMRSTDHSEDNGHPCPKPLSWMRWAVSLASLEGETVFDPFMGSGTTLKAAKELGRKAVGIEIEERYCEIAARRLSQEVMTFPVPA